MISPGFCGTTTRRVSGNTMHKSNVPSAAEIIRQGNDFISSMGDTLDMFKERPWLIERDKLDYKDIVHSILNQEFTYLQLELLRNAINDAKKTASRSSFAE